MRRRTGRIASVIAATSTILATSAGAQQTPATPATPATANTAVTKNSDQIETVVVTANKRKEDASKVATSISVVRGDDLVADHIVDFEDITRAIPNVAFSGGGGGGNSGNGPGLSNIQMRGISSQAGSATAGIYMDDISMTVGNLYSMGIAEPKFFDLDRVEVLRGPQGTLYGASSMGGTIKFITNQPNLKEQEANIYTEVSSTEGGGTNYTANGVFNTALIPNELALRIGVETAHKSGYIDQVSPITGAPIASKINWEDDSVVHMAMKWVPTKNLTVTPALLFQQVTTGDTDVTSLALPTSLQPVLTTLPNNEAAKFTREPGSDQLLVPSLTVGYGTDIGDITSVTSYFQRKFNRVQDGNIENSNYLSTLITPSSTANLSPSGADALRSSINALPSSIILNNQVRQFSQELRIASKPYDPSVSPITWLGGIYLADQHTTVNENDPVYGINAAFAAAGVSPTDGTVISGAVPEGFPNDNSYFAVRHYHDKQQSIFGEANYYFAPTLHATFGLRYIQATDTLDRTGNLMINYSTATDAYGYQQTSSSTSGSAFTPKLALTWEVDPTDTLYATAAEGYRIGGSNFPIPVGNCGVASPNSFASDSLWSYEVGDKSRFFGNKLSINADVFYINWKNLQQLVSLTCGFNYTTNVGNATSYGAELELKAKPISSVTIDLAAGLTHATLTNSDGAAAGVVGAVDGANLPGVPNFNVALSAQYNFNVSGDAYGFVRGASHWVGKSYGGFNPTLSSDPDYNRPSYSTLDLSTGLIWDKWELTLFAKNLLNNDAVIQHPIVQVTTNEAYRIPPRTIGISLSGKL
jgi:outer membrane receptor protein involved in Fe transport